MRLSFFSFFAIASCVSLVHSHAYACGGFFCDSVNQPVNQSAERIIFTTDANGDVTAVIEIKYSGPANKFAWLLPVAGTPEVNVSSNAAFDRLQTATNPQYVLNTTTEGDCGGGGGGGGGGCMASAVGSGSASDGYDAGFLEDDSGVSVLRHGNVGPYDYVVIGVDMAAEDRAQVAVDWLQKNGYTVSDFGTDRLRPYLDGGMNLLAFRLRKGNDSGSLRPVSITFGRGLPMIPLRPTAVAALNDMGVMVWVLGKHRAVPSNYKSLELDEALIDWGASAQNYNDVVTRAANEAGGQGFVTEMSGATDALADTIFTESERAEWQRISETDWTGREGSLVLDVFNQFSSLDGLRDAIDEELAPALGVDTSDIVSCIDCNIGAGMTDIEGFEPANFLKSVEDFVIKPMAATSALFDGQPQVTRFYTTMSAEDMTRDPSFDFNSALGTLSNVHTADRVIECGEDVAQSEASWRITMPNGQVVRGSGFGWPFPTSDERFPANSRVMRIGNEGSGEVVDDNISVIEAALEEHNRSVPRTGDGSGCACRIEGAGGRTAGFGILLAFLGAVFGVKQARFRRARRTPR